MGYSEDDGMVRIDYFKPSGKWYMSEAMKWTGAYKAEEEDLHKAFAHSLWDHCEKRGGAASNEFTVVCLEPYHEHSFPLMKNLGEAIRVYTEALE
jgi:hypothetical protein